MIKPLGERVVIEVAESDVKTASGIVLPDTAKEKPQKGTVVAVGAGKLLDNGERAAMEVKVGDGVIFSKYSGSEVKVEGKDNNLLELIAADDEFPMGLEELEATMQPDKYVGRAPRQVVKYLEEVIQPILDENKDVLGVKAEINV